jgi:biopolymer transport protein ExbD
LTAQKNRNSVPSGYKILLLPLFSDYNGRRYFETEPSITQQKISETVGISRKKRMMNLNNFEDYIDRVICLRGYDYYKNGYVNSVEETETNVYVAEVEGTETYTVDVELDDNLNIIETFCDCPYDMGEFCKHQVAVFFSLREKENSASGEKKSKDRQISNKGHDIEQTLSARTKEELIDFLIKLAAENKEIKQRILLNFDDGDGEEEIIKAISLIQTYIRNNSDRHGFLNYRDTDNAVYGAKLVLEKADAAINEKNVVQAVNLALCVVREMVDLIEIADDSNGSIGGVIENGFSRFDDIIENAELNASEKRIIFESLLKEASHTRYDDWSDWRLNYLEKASRLSDTPELRSELEIQMSIFIKTDDIDSWSGKYFTERVNQIRYDTILRNDGEQKALEFIEQNIQFSNFRKMTIERAMQNKDYDQVIKLTLDGETKDKKFLGLVNKWKEYRYKAYKLSGKLDEQREVAMDFILNEKFEYYKELKNTYSTDEWVNIYPEIILLSEGKNKGYSNIYTKILIEEDEKERLLGYVKKHPSSVERYYKHLIPEFKEEVYKLFIKNIKKTASGASSRKDYQNVCAIINELKKAGGKEQALEIKQELFGLYSNRPAFRDELTKI